MKNKKLFFSISVLSCLLAISCGPHNGGNSGINPDGKDKITFTKFGNKVIEREKSNPKQRVYITLIREKNVLVDDYDEVSYNGSLQAGDLIQIQSDYKYVMLDLFEDFEPALLYLPHGEFCFKVPNSTENAIYKSGIFSKTSHNFSAYVASKEEISSTAFNRAFNPYDFMKNDEINNADAASLDADLDDSISVTNDEIGAYPHAYANRVTRNEVGFYARNAIDGEKQNEGHGNYPYQSWGYNQKEDAVFTLYLGREVIINEINFTLRADYSGSKEHDTYWQDVTLEFSDGSTKKVELNKTKEDQSIEIDNVTTDYVRIKDIHALNSSSSENFAALTELEVYGKEKVNANPVISEKLFVSNFGGKKLNKTSTDKYKASDVANIIDMTNEWFINITETTAYKQPDYNDSPMNVKIDDSLWKDAVFYSGLTDFYFSLGNQNDYYLLRGMFEKFNYTVNNGKPTPHGDYYQIGESYMLIGDYSGGEYKYSDPKRNADYCITRSASDLPTSGLCTYYDKSKGDWSNMAFWWCDALYMALNTYNLLYYITDDEQYVESAYQGYLYHKNKLYNNQYKFWHRDIGELNLKTSSGLPLFWSRGNGWVMAALAKELLYLDEHSFPDIYDAYESDFIDMAESLIQYQREDGLWNPSIIDPNYYAGKEATGTSGYLYGLCTGLELGILDKETYLPVVEKAYEGLLTCLLKDSSGEYTGQMGYMQTTGYQPQNYKNEEHTKTITTEFGQGLWNLGGAAFMRLCSDYKDKEIKVLTSAR